MLDKTQMDLIRTAVEATKVLEQAKEDFKDIFEGAFAVYEDNHGPLTKKGFKTVVKAVYQLEVKQTAESFQAIADVLNSIGAQA